MSEVLIWRKPKPVQPVRVGYTPMGDALYRQGDAFDTIVLARGERDAMLKRWDIADKRLRAYGLPGHVEVRDEADPKVPPAHQGVWTLPLGPEARLALMAGDTVDVNIYGNTYRGTVVKTALKGCVVRFSARTRKGGWGGEPPLRERPFPVMPTSRYGRGVQTVLALTATP